MLTCGCQPEKSKKVTKKHANKKCDYQGHGKVYIQRYPQHEKLKGNLKIHKTSAPMRTIVNSINIPTEKIAEMAEFEPREYIETTPSYIKDTRLHSEIKNELTEEQPENSILFCFDVNSQEHQN